MDDHNHDDDHDHDEQPDFSELLGLDFDAETQVFIEMRGQNLELLKVAAQVAGFAGTHAPLKPGDLRQAMKTIWDIYSEFYQWIDPEETEDELEEDEDE
jgi:hypothetical protein